MTQQPYRCPRCDQPTPRGDKLGPRPICKTCRAVIAEAITASPREVSRRDLARRMGVSRTTIARIAQEMNAVGSPGGRRFIGPGRKCSVPDCAKPMWRIGTGLCQMHCARLERNGSLNVTIGVDGTRSMRGDYVHIRQPRHPLAHADGWVAEHRMVAYDQRDGVCTQCEWCQAPLTWADAHVDHLDFDRANNPPENLIVSCRACNRTRQPSKPMASWAVAVATKALLREYASEHAAHVARINALLSHDQQTDPYAR